MLLQDPFWELMQRKIDSHVGSVTSFPSGLELEFCRVMSLVSLLCLVQERHGPSEPSNPSKPRGCRISDTPTTFCCCLHTACSPNSTCYQRPSHTVVIHHNNNGNPTLRLNWRWTSSRSIVASRTGEVFDSTVTFNPKSVIRAYCSRVLFTLIQIAM